MCGVCGLCLGAISLFPCQGQRVSRKCSAHGLEWGKQGPMMPVKVREFRPVGLVRQGWRASTRVHGRASLEETYSPQARPSWPPYSIGGGP